MALGDVTSNEFSVAGQTWQDIRPGAGVEWIIHNIYHQDNAMLAFYDGTNRLEFDAVVGRGVWAGLAFHVTNSRYIQVLNSMSTSKLIAYDGIVSK